MMARLTTKDTYCRFGTRTIRSQTTHFVDRNHIKDTAIKKTIIERKVSTKESKKQENSKTYYSTILLIRYPA